MKLKALRISNIYSFPYHKDINDSEEIKFDEQLSILIGPNGSGKSNCLEVITQVFNNMLFYGCKFDEERLSVDPSSPNRNLGATLSSSSNVSSLKKDKFSDNEVKSVQVTLILEKVDIENLLFIQSNVVEINNYFQRYSGKGEVFDTTVSKNDIENYRKEITFLFQNDASQQSFTEASRNTDKIFVFVLEYFRSFQFIRNIIKIANSLDDKHWVQLKEIFVLLSGYRNYNQIDGSSAINANPANISQQMREEVRQESTKTATGQQPKLFQYVNDTMNNRLYEIENELKEGTRPNPKNLSAFQIFTSEPMYRNLNEMLKKYLKLTLLIEGKRNTLQYKFTFLDEKSAVVQTSDLSAGEKGILHFIYTIFGYDLENGVAVIDEPELHIHPQMQQRYLSMICDAVNRFGMQFIIATHSPIFITTKTANNVFRFYKDANQTKYVRPTVDEAEQYLIHILKYTNAIKVFFSTDVLLVEGDRDEYLFQVYEDHYRTRNEPEQSIAIININGKPMYPIWRSFLGKYKIKTHYIGDLDNVLNRPEILDPETKEKLLDNYEKNNKETILKESSRNQNYRLTKPYVRGFLLYLRKYELDAWANIVSGIQIAYLEGLYILQKGELEDYLPPQRRNKDFASLIQFCKNEFSNWYEDNTEAELEAIFDNIYRISDHCPSPNVLKQP